MEEKNMSVPYIVYESEAARHERTVKRLIVALIVAICLIVGSNMAWLWVWNQYDFSSESYTLETTDDGNNNLIGAGASANEVINNGIKDRVQTEDSN